MNSMYFDLQEIFYIVFSPCWVVLLAFFVAGCILLSFLRIGMAIWRRRRGAPDESID
jgi:hypothetical protein